MMATTTDPVDEAGMRATILAFLKQHGPMRTKPMFKTTGTPYERGMRVLKAMQADGEIELVQDGYHRGDPVFAWCIKGDTRASKNVVERRTFNGEATLAAMREWAHKMLAAHA
jgi:hypothetical protein